MKEDNMIIIPLRILSADENFVCMLGKSISDGCSLMVMGNLPINFIGCPLRVFGKYTDSGKKGGKKFNATSWQISKPKNKRTLQKMTNAMGMNLSCEEVIALFDRYGEKTLDVLNEGRYSELLEVIPTVTEDELKNIQRILKNTFLEQNVTLLLNHYRLPPYYSSQVKKHYGDRIDEVEKNPYLLCNIRGIEFPLLDEKVRAVRASNYNERDLGRVAAGILYAVDTLQLGGDVCFKPDALLKQTVQTLGLMPSVCEVYIDMAIRQGFLSKYNGYIYLGETEETERALALNVFDIIHSPVPKARDEKIESAIKKAEADSGLTLGEKQLEAIEKAHKNAISIITGGPGCGKTTCINQLIKSFQELKPDIKILAAAPTGRAARRLAEATGLEAKTLHSVLKIPKDGKHPRVKELDADLIIVDEFSMCDLYLSDAFFSRVKIGTTRIVMVGDIDQLPSVDCGNVFADLIKSHAIPTTVLDTTYRQANDSMIKKNAKKINKGKLPLEEGKDFKLAGVGQDIVDATLRCVKFALKSYKPDDIMVLSPFRKSKFGANAMNACLQKNLNPHSPEKNEYFYGKTVFREGDRVMQLVNDGDRDVYNGDIGYITEVVTKTHGEQKKGIEVKFETGNVQFYTASMINELQLAYALTIHKSQGSEFPCVIVMFGEQYKSYRQKSLLYTAITRAKKEVILVSDSKSIAYASTSQSPLEAKGRNSFLAARLNIRELRRKREQEKLKKPPKEDEPKKKSSQIEGQLSLNLESA